MAIEIPNVVQAIATVAVDPDDGAYFCGQSGFRSVERVELGVYQLIPNDPLDNRVPTAVGQPLPVYRQPILVHNLDPISGNTVGAIPVPCNVPETPTAVPGSVKVYLKDDAGVAIDVGFFTVIVFSQPSELASAGVATA